MKLLSILIIIAAIMLFAAGLWLWSFLFCVAVWFINSNDWSLIKRKADAIKHIWNCDAFCCYTREGRDTYIRSFCSELDIIQAKEMADSCVEQTRAVESVKEIIEKYNGE